MALDEAIKILEQMIDETFNPFREEALRLGIEALELYYALRGSTAIDVDDIPSRLPSEPD